MYTVSLLKFVYENEVMNALYNFGNFLLYNFGILNYTIFTILVNIVFAPQLVFKLSF